MPLPLDPPLARGKVLRGKSIRTSKLGRFAQTSLRSAFPRWRGIKGVASMRQPFSYLSYMEASKENFHLYNTNLQPFANNLRKRMTKAEACLWKYALRASKLKGYGFRRQRPVLNYIADFMCKELMLIIEVDGITHQDEQVIENDKLRQARLEAAGFTVLRFNDDEVLKNIKGVINTLEDWIENFEVKKSTAHAPDTFPTKHFPPLSPSRRHGAGD